jgi:hypothetical protein
VLTALLAILAFALLLSIVLAVATALTESPGLPQKHDFGARHQRHI